MSDIAIKVNGLGKRYRIGGSEAAYKTIRESVVELVQAPFRRLSSAARGQPDASSADVVWALRDISFEVQRGEVVGLVGRNGAGKSTLLKILSRITRPTEGRAVIDGRVGSLLEVGTGFHRELTGRENIYLNGAILGMRRAEIERKFDEIVAFAQIEKFLDTPVKHYSTGMHVRLAFSVAAHLEPDILLVDEVLAVGDASFQKKCLDKMEDVAGGGRTVLFVSHNMTAVQHMCGRAIVLEKGKIAFNGDTMQAVARYLSAGAIPNHGFADLEGHPGRMAKMRPTMQSLALLSGDGVEPYRDTITTGEDVVFELRYDTGDTRLDYALLMICTNLGERVCALATYLSPGFDAPLLGKGVLTCAAPHLALAHGEYQIMAVMGTRRPFTYVDCVEDALRIRVKDGNYFGSGDTLLPGQGHVAQRSNWSCATGAK